MYELLLLALGASLVNNFVLTNFLGLCPFVGVSRRFEAAAGMALATLFVLTIASGLSFAVWHWVLQPLGLEYLRTLVFILLIAGVAQFTEFIVRATNPLLHQMLGIFLPLITTNCAVLGVALLNVDRQHGLLESLVYGASAGAGFGLALLLFAALRERLESARRAAAFRGAPIALDHGGPDGARVHGFQRTRGAMSVSAIVLRVRSGGAARRGARGALGFVAARMPGSDDPSSIASTHCCRRRSAANASLRAVVLTPWPSRGAADIDRCPPGGAATSKELARCSIARPAARRSGLWREQGAARRVDRRGALHRVRALPARVSRRCHRGCASLPAHRQSPMQCTGCDSVRADLPSRLHRTARWCATTVAPRRPGQPDHAGHFPEGLLLDANKQAALGRPIVDCAGDPRVASWRSTRAPVAKSSRLCVRAMLSAWAPSWRALVTSARRHSMRPCPVVSSRSRPRAATAAGTARCVVIESDGEDRRDAHLPASTDITALDAGDPDPLLNDAGIAGLGGAAFPTATKLRAARTRAARACC
jgi:electron transport complex protein RnfA